MYYRSIPKEKASHLNSLKNKNLTKREAVFQAVNDPYFKFAQNN